jgi:hypothetical protein
MGIRARPLFVRVPAGRADGSINLTIRVPVHSLTRTHGTDGDSRTGPNTG